MSASQETRQPPESQPVERNLSVHDRKEDCTVAYTGDTLVNAANMTNLSAQFGELDASHGDWNGQDDHVHGHGRGDGVPYVSRPSTNAAGVASTTAALGPNVYGVGVSFAGDDYYLGCASAEDTLRHGRVGGTAKITGGGWISQRTGHTSFGFNVIRDVTGLKGQLQVRSKGGKDRFHSTSVLTLNTSGPPGTWTGTGRWNGIDRLLVHRSRVVDNGTSGKKGDTISIVIKSPTNVTVFTTSGAQPLKGGNIVVQLRIPVSSGSLPGRPYRCRPAQGTSPHTGGDSPPVRWARRVARAYVLRARCADAQRADPKEAQCPPSLATTT